MNGIIRSSLLPTVGNGKRWNMPYTVYTPHLVDFWILTAGGATTYGLPETLDGYYVGGAVYKCRVRLDVNSVQYFDFASGAFSLAELT